RHAVEADRANQLVDKLLSRQVSHTQLRLVFMELMTDSVEEMSFAEADAAIEAERVVRDRWALSHPLGGRQGERVRLAFNEIGKEIFRIEPGGHYRFFHGSCLS